MLRTTELKKDSVHFLVNWLQKCVMHVCVCVCVCVCMCMDALWEHKILWEIKNFLTLVYLQKTYSWPRMLYWVTSGSVFWKIIYFSMAALALCYWARALSHCGVEATLWLWCAGLVALRQLGSAWTRDRTYVLSIGRRILTHETTTEVPPGISTFSVS